MRFKNIYESVKFVIYEGGNVKLDTGEEAEKIDMTKVNANTFASLKNDLLKAFFAINDSFKSFSGKPLWKDIKKLSAEGKIFSGSTRAFFTKPFDEFVKFKSKVGDMDLQVSEHDMPKLKEFLNASKGKKFGEFVFSGFTNAGTQFNGLLKAPDKYAPFSKFIQVDFEGVPYDSDEPSEFATFGHYSSWTDIKAGVKGLAIKYLLRAMSAGLKKMKIVLVSPKTGKPIKTKPLENFYGFSVDKGFREKIKPNLDAEGNLIHIDGIPSYIEVAPKDAKYEQSLERIYEVLFGEVPDQMQKKSLFSFIKTLQLMNEYWGNNKKKIADVFDDFIDLLWGSSAQQLERGNPTLDNEIKETMYREFVRVFPYLKQKESAIGKLKEEFYSKYKV